MDTPLAWIELILEVCAPLLSFGNNFSLVRVRSVHIEIQGTFPAFFPYKEAQETWPTVENKTKTWPVPWIICTSLDFLSSSAT